jgi:hypothetical protein
VRRPPRRLIFAAFGVTVAVELPRSGAPVLARDLERSLLPLRRVRGDVRVARRYSVDGSVETVVRQARRILHRGPAPAPALEALAADVHHFVALRAPGWIFVHAGVVEYGGRAILLPGRSRAGKSTLVAELVRRGAGYYSDEYAVLDGDGRVHPFPRRLALRSGPLGPGFFRAEDFGGRVGRRPLAVGAILALRFAGAEAAALSPLSAGAAVLELLDNTLTVRARPRAALRAVASAVRAARGGALRGTRGEAAAFARRLLAVQGDSAGALAASGGGG